MKNIFIPCSAKEFYEVLKPLLLTLEGYTMYEDEWAPMNNGCRIHSNGHWFPFQYQANYTEIDLDEFIASVRPKKPIDLRDRFIPCAEEQADEVCDMLDALGCNTEGFTEPRVWKSYCEGVKVYCDLSYQTFENFDNFPTLTVEELREIANSVKP